MCFDTGKSRKPIPKTAKKDIIVYKRLHNSRPLHYNLPQNGKYVKGVIHSARMKLVKDYSWATWTIENGFHSFKNKPYEVTDSFVQTVTFVIPKGAKYFENSIYFVSNKIMRK